ncbi:MAG: hypothetical protein ACE364_10995 [Chlorobiota bacterium]
MTIKKIKIIRIYSSAAILAMLFFLSGCPDENDGLVNPPSQAETINIRFINLAGDYSPRSALFTNQVVGPITYAQSSEASNPPDDSVQVTIEKNGQAEYKKDLQVKFFRELNYTFFAIPTSPSDSTHPKDVDSVVVINTSLTIPDVTNDGYIRLVNLYPDTTTNFSLTLGCAGGTSLAGGVTYRRVSSSEPVISGENTFSITYFKDGATQSLGLFGLDMDQKGEYAFVIIENQSGEPEVYVLDELNTSEAAFSKAEPIESKETFIRNISFSNRDFDINLDEQIISTSPQQYQISDYETVEACGGTSVSSLTSISQGDTIGYSTTNLEVLKNYTLYSFDTQDSVRQVLAPPFRLFDEKEGKSVIRVINGHPDYEGITVSFGARKLTGIEDSDSPEDELSYGETIARDIKFGRVSDVGVFESGFSPITIFESSQPAKYITGINKDLLPDKSYSIVIYKDNNGEPAVTIIEDGDIEKEIEVSEPGVFVQVVNAVAGSESVQVGLGEIIKQNFADLFYSLNFATVIPVNQTEVKINGVSKQIDVEEGKRVLIVASGTEGNEEVLTYIYEPLEKEDSHYKIRFLNASSEIDDITVARYDLVDCPDCPILANAIKYDELSFVQEVFSEAKISLYIYNPDDLEERYHRVDDLKLNFNKAFTVVFAGNSSLGNNEDDDNTNNGYSIILLQEF